MLSDIILACTSNETEKNYVMLTFKFEFLGKFFVQSLF